MAWQSALRADLQSFAPLGDGYTPGTTEVSMQDYWKGRENEEADKAKVMFTLVNLDLRTLQQTYFFVIFEYNGDKVRRKSACRSATRQRGDKLIYVSSYLSLPAHVVSEEYHIFCTIYWMNKADVVLI